VRRAQQDPVCGQTVATFPPRGQMSAARHNMYTIVTRLKHNCNRVDTLPFFKGDHPT
jgi:hypothetical protein